MRHNVCGDDWEGELPRNISLPEHFGSIGVAAVNVGDGTRLLVGNASDDVVRAFEALEVAGLMEHLLPWEGMYCTLTDSCLRLLAGPVGTELICMRLHKCSEHDVEYSIGHQHHTVTADGDGDETQNAWDHLLLHSRAPVWAAVAWVLRNVCTPAE